MLIKAEFCILFTNSRFLFKKFLKLNRYQFEFAPTALSPFPKTAKNSIKFQKKNHIKIKLKKNIFFSKFSALFLYFHKNSFNFKELKHFEKTI